MLPLLLRAMSSLFNITFLEAHQLILVDKPFATAIHRPHYGLSCHVVASGKATWSWNKKNLRMTVKGTLDWRRVSVEDRIHWTMAQTLVTAKEPTNML
ncbi:hypothetical protein F4860DRAFT_484814 [Xylaria cubensis]|nr:hypothetical protein F4860DRAFT_484814 [Xylaria cubensis]